MAVPAGGGFDQREPLGEQLRAGPDEAARQEMAPTPSGPRPSRWTLRAIRASSASLQHYSLSGLWRLLRAQGLRLRAAAVQHYSPDGAYAAKLDHLLGCLALTTRSAGRLVLVFLDEMGYQRWPAPAPDWTATAPSAPPLAERQSSSQQQWRVIGALNALSGQVSYLDNYIVGRQQVSTFYRQLVQVYPTAERIYVVQDNWSIHKHADVQAT
jgi:hypothetical protein